MLIQELKNPITENYITLKNSILSESFPWYSKITTRESQGTTFYSHMFLKRPSEKNPFSEIVSNYFDQAYRILLEILKYNNLHINYFLRINANITHNYGSGIACSPHYDHDFPHKNLLIYLNQASGPTVVINPENKTEEYFHPKEDAIITFEGKHYHYQPDVGERRIVLVATYL
jgi:hypothetical protein